MCVCVCSDCNGCGRDIKNGQALVALGGQWHLGCFKCKVCQRVLSGEYISKYVLTDIKILHHKIVYFHVKSMCRSHFRDGVPYCEKDYQIQYGVQCEECQKYITGKVLEVREIYCSNIKNMVWAAASCFDCLVFFRRQETNTITPAVRGVAAVTECSQKEMKCMYKVS